jgi:hypothetical protein
VHAPTNAGTAEDQSRKKVIAMKKVSVLVIWILLGAVLSGCASSQVSPTATAEPPVPPTATQAVPATAPPAADPLWVADGVIGEGEYAHETEAAGVTLRWANDDEYLYAALEAQTEGWVAVGFDPEDRMKGANFIFGYVSGGQTSIHDMFGTRPFGPGSHPSDEQLGGQNHVAAFGGIEEGGRTIVEFKIPLDSGDEYDKPLRAGSTYPILLAVGSSDSIEMYHAGRDYSEVAID